VRWSVLARRRAAHKAAAVLAVTCLLGTAACSDDGGANGNTAGSPSAGASATPSEDPELEAALNLHADGKLDEAKAAYSAILAKDATNKFALYNLGLIAQTQGDDDEAASRYEATLAVDPAYGPALFNNAIVKEKSGDDEGAEALYRRALQAAPGDASAHFNLGLLLTRTDRETEGNAQLDEAFNLNPSLRSRLEGSSASPSPSPRR
jgi:tetratricopeptide (TPR) repeat protein